MMNGSLECEYRKYEIFEGKYNDFKRETGGFKEKKKDGVADFDFRVTGPAQGELDFADYVRGGPLQRFVDDGDVALFEVDSL